jgi:IS5 family transposase
LFDHYADLLQKRGLITNTGTIVDASFVEVPRQRKTREENALVKSGETPTQWNDAPRKLCQKDVDARWAKKNEQSFYGFKNHIRADAESKLITDYVVTDASVHDSQALP